MHVGSLPDADAFDEHLMRRALELARRGEGRVEPNPMVGAVIAAPVDNGIGGPIIAEGWHAAFGGPHAEVVARVVAARRIDAIDRCQRRSLDVALRLVPVERHAGGASNRRRRQQGGDLRPERDDGSAHGEQAEHQTADQAKPEVRDGENSSYRVWGHGLLRNNQRRAMLVTRCCGGIAAT